MGSRVKGKKCPYHLSISWSHRVFFPPSKKDFLQTKREAKQCFKATAAMADHLTSRRYTIIIIAVLILISTVANISDLTRYFNVASDSNDPGPPLSSVSMYEEHASTNNNTTTTTPSPPKLQLYLEGKTENAGLGHSFMALNHLVTMAHQHNLSTRLVMMSTDNNHGFDLLYAMRIKRYFIHDLLMTPLPNGETTTTTCVRIKTSPQSLEEDVNRVKREWYDEMRHYNQTTAEIMQQQSTRSSNKYCTIFVMKDVRPNAYHMDQNLPLYRHLFELNDKNDTRQSIIHRKQPIPSSSTTTNVINIAIHIRRGDLFQFVSKSLKKEKSWGKFQARQRIVPVSAYTSLLRQLLTIKLLDGGGDNNNIMKRGEIRITVYCEGMIGNATVPDADGTMIDLQREIMIGLTTTTTTTMIHDDVTFVAGDEDPLQAFDDICYSSNIFIAGASAFSHLVGVLCPKPIILAMQDLNAAFVKYSYNYIPNAMMMDVTWREYSLPNVGLDGGVELINGATFNETQFERLWGEMNT
jgi:hypothetical protein